ncbi:hypothetical protein D3C78_1656990 [compost metagenome]
MICTGAVAVMPPGSWKTMLARSMSTDHCSASSRCQVAQCALVAALMPSTLWAMKAWTSKGWAVSDMRVASVKGDRVRMIGQDQPAGRGSAYTAVGRS